MNGGWSFLEMFSELIETTYLHYMKTKNKRTVPK